MNLIINASEAIGEETGAIEVSTRLLSLSHDEISLLLEGEELSEGEYVQLRVSDTGCGMDEITMKKVFDPFFTTKFTGRGLGMSAILGIVRGHGGGLRLHSSVGQGTTFEVFFPAAKAE